MNSFVLKCGALIVSGSFFFALFPVEKNSFSEVPDPIKIMHRNLSECETQLQRSKASCLCGRVCTIVQRDASQTMTESVVQL